MAEDNRSGGDRGLELRNGEWAALCIILGLVIILTVLSLGKEAQQIYPLASIAERLSSKEIELYIQGAVARPGLYKVPLGAFLSDVVALADPLPEANLSPFKSTRKARHGQVVTVLPAKMVEVHIAGAVVREGVYRVPQTVKLKELSNYVQLAQDANIDKIGKNRRVRNGETIVIPRVEGRVRKLEQSKKRGKIAVVRKNGI